MASPLKMVVPLITVPKVVIGDAQPRPHVNKYKQGGRSLVSKIYVDPKAKLRGKIEQAVELIGGFGRVINEGDIVLLKANFNSDYPYPASSDPEFVKETIDLLYSYGAQKVFLGECSGNNWLPTLNVLRRLGMTEVAAGVRAEVKALEQGKWINVRINAKYLKETSVPDLVYSVDKVIYLPCMKTHNRARFSLSLKLGIGLMHPKDRVWLHLSNLEEKIAEFNLAVRPDLIILDGRTAFVSGGPNKGEIVEPRCILASADQIATDIEALKVLKSYPAKNRLDKNIWELSQIKTAVVQGLGATSEKDYQLLEI